jgi:integrase/recombinase XerD
VNKLKILSVRDITFKEGCELYLDNCRERNLREGTIEHYKNSYKQLYKFFNPNMPISQINSDMYKKYVLYLRERIISFQDYRLLCQLVFKIDSLLEKIDLLKWAEKLIAN